MTKFVGQNIWDPIFVLFCVQILYMHMMDFRNPFKKNKNKNIKLIKCLIAD